MVKAVEAVDVAGHDGPVGVGEDREGDVRVLALEPLEDSLGRHDRVLDAAHVDLALELAVVRHAVGVGLGRVEGGQHAPQEAFHVELLGVARDAVLDVDTRLFLGDECGGLHPAGAADGAVAVAADYETEDLFHPPAAALVGLELCRFGRQLLKLRVDEGRGVFDR